MKRSKNKKIKRRKRPACGLCGRKTNLTRTECCGQWICDDEDQYVPFSYARNSCYRNHRRYTLCGYHHAERHEGNWKDCRQCREDFSDELEMYVEYGTNEYNFEKLPNPPKFEPTYCSQCGKRIILAEGGYSVQGNTYTCGDCNSQSLDFPNPLVPLEDEEDDIYEEGEQTDFPQRFSADSIEDLSEEIVPHFEAIAILIKRFCDRHDVISFSFTCMDMAISLCVQFPEIISRGKVEGWAGGIVHALAMVNFMDDITMANIQSFFKMSQGTIQSKSKQIRDLFGTYPMDPLWSLPETLLENPALWIVPIDGFLIDIREAPPKTQQKALELGLIPMLPETLKQHIQEYEDTLAEIKKSKPKGCPADEHAKIKQSKPNIKIADYIEPETAPQKSLPLFDPKEK